MSEEKVRPRVRPQRSHQPEPARVEKTSDDDPEQVPPPLSLIALFVLPLVLLLVWALVQG